MRLFRLLNQLNWKVYLMELIIVILGISIAYQVNIVYEKGVNQQLELSALENLRKENDINLKEFESLEAYRARITDRTKKLGSLIRKGPLVKDSVEQHIFWLVQTSTPDLQHEASNFYLSSNYSNNHLKLKNELLTLKTFLQELSEMSEGYRKRKNEDFMIFLRDAVDFDAREVVNLKKLETLAFKNIIWSQAVDEHELNRLYDQAYAQLKLVQHKVDSTLTKAR